jgi:hypothetical protein
MSAGNSYKARTAACVLVAMLTACGGGGGGSSGGGAGPSGGGGTAQALAPGAITISWSANRERGVNSAGGGYEVSITGQPTVTVPYVSGASAPTSIAVTLTSGSYLVSVRAFAALDAQGGASRTFSAPQTMTLNIP